MNGLGTKYTIDDVDNYWLRELDHLWYLLDPEIYGEDMYCMYITDDDFEEVLYKLVETNDLEVLNLFGIETDYDWDTGCDFLFDYPEDIEGEWIYNDVTGEIFKVERASWEEGALTVA